MTAPNPAERFTPSRPIRIAHLINPFMAPVGSPQQVAQEITFESLRRAREVARGQVDVRLLCTGYPEDHEIIPEYFDRTPDLERSVLDLGDFKPPRKLPLIHDIIGRLRNAAENADFLVYSNSDIAVMPNFYLCLRYLFGQHDALLINRRTISGEYQGIEDMELIYAEAGTRHPGFDCAAFKPRIAAAMDLGGLCVGIARFFRGICMWMAGLAENLGVFWDLHLTFHIGNAKDWLRPGWAAYTEHNLREYNSLLERLSEVIGPIERHRMAAAMSLESSRHWLRREQKLIGLHQQARNLLRRTTALPISRLKPRSPSG